MWTKKKGKKIKVKKKQYLYSALPQQALSAGCQFDVFLTFENFGNDQLKSLTYTA